MPSEQGTGWGLPEKRSGFGTVDIKGYVIYLIGKICDRTGMGRVFSHALDLPPTSSVVARPGSMIVKFSLRRS